MAQKFTITAELNLQTKNLNQVVNNLRQQFQGANLNVKIRDLAKAEASIRTMNKNIGNTNKSMKGLVANIGAAAKRFSAIALATGTFVGLTRAVKNAVGSAIEFEKEMVKISQATGRTLSQLEGLKTEIGAVASSFGVASDELIKAARELTQAGFAADKVRGTLKLLAQTELSATFDSIADTTEGVIAVLNQFGKEAQRTGREVEFLERSLSAISQVSKEYAVESADLITAIRTTGSAFETAGGSLDELIALFTSVRSTTRESAESISTGFRTIFTRMQRLDTINSLKKLGIDLQDVEGKFVGPMEAVKRLSIALSSLDPKDFRFNLIVEELGGFRQVSKVIPLIQQFTVAQKALGVAQNSSGSLAKDAATAQQSLGNQIQKTREEFQRFIRDLTQSKTFQDTARFLLDMASAFIKVADVLKPLIPLISGFAAIKLGQAMLPGLQSLGKMGRKNAGGPIGFASGGLVPGQGNGDTVPAMLTPGEFVIRKSSVNKLGADKLAGMNKYGKGGVIVAPSPKLEKSHIGDAVPFSDAKLKSLLTSESGNLKLKRSFISRILKQDVSNIESSQDANKVISANLSKIKKGIQEELGFKAQVPLMLNLPASFNQALRSGNPDLVGKQSLINYIINSGDHLSTGLPEALKGVNTKEFRKKLANQIETIPAIPANTKDQNENNLPAYDNDPELSSLKPFLKSQLQRHSIDATKELFSKRDILFRGSGYKGRSSQERDTINLKKFKSAKPELLALGGQAGKSRAARSITVPHETEYSLDKPAGADLDAKVGGKYYKLSAEDDIDYNRVNKNIDVDKIASKIKNKALLEAYYGFAKNKDDVNRGRVFEKLLLDAGEMSSLSKIGNARLDGISADGSPAEIKSTAMALNAVDFEEKLYGAVAENRVDAEHILRDRANKAKLTAGADTLKLGSIDLFQDITSGLGKEVESKAKARYGEKEAKAAAKEAAVSAVANQKQRLTGIVDKNFRSGFNIAGTQYGPLTKSGDISRDLVAALNKSFAGDFYGAMGTMTDAKIAEAVKSKLIKKMAKGGLTEVPWMSKGGEMGTDTVPAMLTPGEFVINKKSAEKIGYSSLNRMNKVGKFAKGGPVGVQHFAAGGTALDPQVVMMLAEIKKMNKTQGPTPSGSAMNAEIAKFLKMVEAIRKAGGDASTFIKEGFAAIKADAANFKISKELKGIFQEARTNTPAKQAQDKQNSLDAYDAKIRDIIDSSSKLSTGLMAFGAVVVGVTSQMTGMNKEYADMITAATGTFSAFNAIGQSLKTTGASFVLTTARNKKHQEAMDKDTTAVRVHTGAMTKTSVGGDGSDDKFLKRFEGGLNIVEGAITGFSAAMAVQAAMSAKDNAKAQKSSEKFTQALEKLRKGIHNEAEVRSTLVSTLLLSEKAQARQNAMTGTGGAAGSAIGGALAAVIVGLITKDVKAAMMAAGIGSAIGGYAGIEGSVKFDPKKITEAGNQIFTALSTSVNGINRVNKLLDKIDTKDTALVSSELNVLSSELAKAQTAANSFEIDLSTASEEMKKQYNESIESANNFKNALDRVVGEMTNRTIKKMQEATSLGSVTTTGKINQLTEDQRARIESGAASEYDPKIKQARAKSKKKGDLEDLRAQALEGMKNQTVNKELNDYKKLLTEANIQILKQERALIVERQAREKIIGTLAKENALKATFERLNFSVKEAADSSNALDAAFSDSVQGLRTSIPDSSIFNLEFPDPAKLKEALDVVSSIGPIGQELANNLNDINKVTPGLDAFLTMLSSKKFGDIDISKDLDKNIKDMFNIDVSGPVGSALKEIIKQKYTAQDKGDAGGGTIDREAIKKEFENFAKELKEKGQHIISSMEELDKKQRMIADKLIQSDQRRLELANQGVDSYGKMVDAIAKWQGKSVPLALKNGMRFQKMLNLLGKDATKSIPALGADLRDARAKLDAGNLKPLEAAQLSSKANKLQGALKQLANQADRTSDVLSELEKAKANREQIQKNLQDYAFGSDEDRAGMDKAAGALNTAISTGDINSVEGPMRKEVLGLLDSMGDAGKQIKKQLTANFFASMGQMDLAQAASAEATTPEMQMIGELQKIYQEEIAAQQQLMSLEDQYSKGQLAEYEKITQKLAGIKDELSKLYTDAQQPGKRAEEALGGKVPKLTTELIDTEIKKQEANLKVINDNLTTFNSNIGKLNETINKINTAQQTGKKVIEKDTDIGGAGIAVGGLGAGAAAQNKAQGGLVYLADGGTFKPKGTDTVPAMLTPGEFVMKKSAVDRIGVGNLSAMNKGGSVGYYAYGGLVDKDAQKRIDEEKDPQVQYELARKYANMAKARLDNSIDDPNKVMLELSKQAVGLKKIKDGYAYEVSFESILKNDENAKQHFGKKSTENVQDTFARDKSDIEEATKEFLKSNGKSVSNDFLGGLARGATGIPFADLAQLIAKDLPSLMGVQTGVDINKLGFGDLTDINLFDYIFKQIGLPTVTTGETFKFLGYDVNFADVGDAIGGALNPLELMAGGAITKVAGGALKGMLAGGAKNFAQLKGVKGSAEILKKVKGGIAKSEAVQGGGNFVKTVMDAVTNNQATRAFGATTSAIKEVIGMVLTPFNWIGKKIADTAVYPIESKLSRTLFDNKAMNYLWELYGFRIPKGAAGNVAEEATEGAAAGVVKSADSSGGGVNATAKATREEQEVLAAKAAKEAESEASKLADEAWAKNMQAQKEAQDAMLKQRGLGGKTPEEIAANANIPKGATPADFAKDLREGESLAKFPPRAGMGDEAIDAAKTTKVADDAIKSGDNVAGLGDDAAKSADNIIKGKIPSIGKLLRSATTHYRPKQEEQKEDLSGNKPPALTQPKSESMLDDLMGDLVTEKKETQPAATKPTETAAKKKKKRRRKGYGNSMAFGDIDFSGMLMQQAMADQQAFMNQWNANNAYGASVTQGIINQAYGARGMMGMGSNLFGGGIGYFATGGMAKGTDTVPAMLTPGEFVMSKSAVDKHGAGMMQYLNSGGDVLDANEMAWARSSSGLTEGEVNVQRSDYLKKRDADRAKAQASLDKIKQDKETAKSVQASRSVVGSMMPGAGFGGWGASTANQGYGIQQPAAAAATGVAQRAAGATLDKVMTPGGTKGAIAARQRRMGPQTQQAAVMNQGYKQSRIAANNAFKQNWVNNNQAMKQQMFGGDRGPNATMNMGGMATNPEEAQRAATGGGGGEGIVAGGLGESAKVLSQASEGFSKFTETLSGLAQQFSGLTVTHNVTVTGGVTVGGIDGKAIANAINTEISQYIEKQIKNYVDNNVKQEGRTPR